MEKCEMPKGGNKSFNFGYDLLKIHIVGGGFFTIRPTRV